ncbi:hypothetical protein C4D60_Mb08t25620 [Musa balbisiana]|uniref:Uncharacterized protein n=1 Tax=Musa balbisiana TaxID=52838 RepID=A0A4V4H969_MUSBA|nr:hypothetical protein C4D60_Mb08t25620 [Musa balbisiana]
MESASRSSGEEDEPGRSLGSSQRGLRCPVTCAGRAKQGSLNKLERGERSIPAMPSNPMTVTVDMPVPSAVPITVAFPLRSPPYVSPAAFRPSPLPGSCSAPFLYHAVSPESSPLLGCSSTPHRSPIPGFSHISAAPADVVSDPRKAGFTVGGERAAAETGGHGAAGFTVGGERGAADETGGH